MVNDNEQYLIKHIQVLKNYRHPTNPLSTKNEVKFYYHRKYIKFVKDYKIKHGLKPYDKTGYIPLCLRSFRIFLAYNNLWWLIIKEHLTDEELEILKELGLEVYFKKYNFY